MAAPLPIPKDELWLALGTVAFFLPAVVIVHRTLSWLLRALVSKSHAQ
jgi:hypothetical protein